MAGWYSPHPVLSAASGSLVHEGLLCRSAAQRSVPLAQVVSCPTHEQRDAAEEQAQRGYCQPSRAGRGPWVDCVIAHRARWYAPWLHRPANLDN